MMATDTYYLLLDMLEKPQINFMPLPPPGADMAAIKKDVLHSFVNHHYMDHDLTEDEANDLHLYVDERNYV